VTDAHPADPERVGSEESEPTGPRVTDRRRLDPVTGAVRQPPAAEASFDEAADQAAAVVAGEAFEVPGATKVAKDPEASEGSGAAGVPKVGDAGDVETDQGEDLSTLLESVDAHPDTTLAADLTRDLQRLQAEYVNYKRRVDRDREMHRDLAVGSVIETLLPVLDDIHLARQHGDLEGGPFAAIADKLDGTLTKIGVERFGQPGDPFDPNVHEALMHIEAELAEGTEATTVVQVLQPGYRIAQRIIRPARVAVADPPPTPPI